MFDYFWKSQGDLTDIFQGSAIGGPATAITDTSQSTADPAAALPPSTDGFLDSFAVDAKDPTLHELVGTGFFGSSRNSLEKVNRQPPPPTSPPPPALVTPAIKRRKNQAKKVVCIPAPAVASNYKAGGEVVPSDLWAWRKYGQKPIKGSPYPRGYYRCSSSKGCSARKQVERSRTDPNMLVITYTSDHNHPWPTQKNALAGSTRPQSSKNNNNASSSKTNSSFNQKLPEEKITIREEEEEEEAKWSPTSFDDFPSVTKMKEMEKNSAADEQLDDDFFADLAVLDGDPMSTLDEEKNNNNAMDYFNMLGWDGGNSFGVRKRS